MNYFLMKKEKISKSKGNGISIEQWLRYASPESLAFYMYPNPKRAKKLYSEVVPKTVDEYLSFIEKYPKQEKKDQILNPVWHVHNGKPPVEKIFMPFSMLLNLVGSSNANNKKFYGNLLIDFIKKLNLLTTKFLMDLQIMQLIILKIKWNLIKNLKNQIQKKKRL